LLDKISTLEYRLKNLNHSDKVREESLLLNEKNMKDFVEKISLLQQEIRIEKERSDRI
jgi:hypothetical protein